MKSLTFNQLVQVINYDQFQKIVKKYNGDLNVKSFKCWHLLKVMLFCNFSKCTSLRKLVNLIRSTGNKFYHFGIVSISRNNLSNANKKRDWRIFRDLFFDLKSKFENGLPSKNKKFKFKHKLHSVDATVISLCLELYSWATFRSTKAGIKLHVILNNENNNPTDVIVTNANRHDSTVVPDFKIESGSIYILDRAYSGAKTLYTFVKMKSFFVTRLKKKVKYKIIKRNKVSLYQKKQGVKTDWIIRFTGKKYNDYPQDLRLVRYKDSEKNKLFEFLTNLTEISSNTISKIYKDRWQVEIFFKLIKQNLKIESLIGRNENSVLIQIWTALISYLILNWFKYKSKFKEGFCHLVELIRQNLLKAKDIFSLLNFENSYKDRDIKLHEKQLWLF